MSELRFVTLMEDNLYGNGLIAEHGLSIYVETKKHKILVDTGQSEKTWDNAKIKGIDLAAIDIVFLSHGHYDHSGGLMKFAAINSSADLYMHELAGGEYYSLKESGEKYIGIDKDILNLDNLHLIKRNEIIDEELSVFTDVQPRRNWPQGNSRLHELKEKQYVQDSFGHEMYLVIRFENEKYALISGCAHKGILNIIDAFKEIYRIEPSIVISGFHMIQSDYSEDDLQMIEDTAEELSKMNTVFYTGHCTGETAFGILKDRLGDQLQAIRDL